MTDQPSVKPKRRTSQKRRRNKQVVTRLSDDEFRSASEGANRSGLTMGAYSRAAMLGDPGPGSQHRLPIDEELLLRTLGLLGHLNHRVDQIAPNTPDVSEIRQIAKDYVEIRDAIFAALAFRRKRG